MSDMVITDVVENDIAVAGPRLSKLAIAAIIFAVTGPVLAGAMWLASFSDFPTMPHPLLVALFACGSAWILAAFSGTRAIRLICLSQGRLIGREYAVAAIVISGVWMVVVLVALLLPALFSVNS